MILPDFDIILCVSEDHIELSKISIKNLRKFTRADNIYVITSEKNFSSFESINQENINLLDEDSIIEGINFDFLEKDLVSRIGTGNRTGWYYQQFLKIGFSRLCSDKKYYLIWDSDTILLNDLEFFESDGKTFITRKEEYHTPYFRTLKNLFGFDRVYQYSFISENLMINADLMNKMIKEISLLDPKKHWVTNILDSIDEKDLLIAGFSEYETYGNYVFKYNRNEFVVRDLKTMRKGAKYFGNFPNNYDLYYLKNKNYIYVTFEKYHRRKLRPLLFKSIAALSYFIKIERQRITF